MNQSQSEIFMNHAQVFFQEHEISNRITIYEFGHDLPVNYFRDYINKNNDVYEAVAHFGIALYGYYNKSTFYKVTYTALSRSCFDCFLSYCLGLEKYLGVTLHEVREEAVKRPHLRSLSALFKWQGSV